VKCSEYIIILFHNNVYRFSWNLGVMGEIALSLSFARSLSRKEKKYIWWQTNGCSARGKDARPSFPSQSPEIVTEKRRKFDASE
jgi:hypothetical protein